MPRLPALTAQVLPSAAGACSSPRWKAMEKTLPTPRDREVKEEVRETEIERDCRMMYNMQRGESVVLFFLASSPQFWRRADKLQVARRMQACSYDLPTPTANTQVQAIARHCLPVRTKHKDHRECL